MRNVLFILFLSLSGVSFTQFDLLSYQKDTLTYAHRTGSQYIDSLDLNETALYSNVSRGAWNNPFGRFGTDYALTYANLISPFKSSPALQPTFAAIPHLGFLYSFGSGGTQYVHADYQQTFKKKIHVNLTYDRNVSQGFIRNGTFKNNNFQLLQIYEGKRYEEYFSARIFKSESGLNGGIVSDSLIEIAGLEFVPVFKSNALSTLRHTELETGHYVNFRADSTQRQGVFLESKLDIQNRVFTEEDDLQQIYTNVFIDTLATRDQYQFAKFRQRGGYFIKQSKFRASVFADYAYWRFQNLAQNRDTTEVSLGGKVAWVDSSWRLTNEFTFTFIGAVGEIHEKAELTINQSRFNHRFQFVFERNLPAAFQRFYNANNFSWKLNSLELQQHLRLSYLVRVPGKLKIQAGVNYAVHRNNYVFIENQWRNDSIFSNFSILNLHGRLNLNWKSLYFQPAAHVNLVSEGFDFIPQLDLRARLFFNKKFFKARKFDFIAGVDFRSPSKYRLMNYESALDLFRIDQSTVVYSTPQLRLDAFLGFQIDDFRFYFRYENVDYNWNQKTALEQLRTPISPSVLRIGITWDFFN
jgi:hypothetical protein